MNTPLKALQALGQSIWIDNISREMLMKKQLQHYIDDYAVTGLTSNPTIFEHAIGRGSFYDDAIKNAARHGEPVEDLFFTLALQDLTAAADLFRPIHDETEGIDGWVSLEVSPLLVDDSAKTVAAAAWLHAAGDGSLPPGSPHWRPTSTEARRPPSPTRPASS